MDRRTALRVLGLLDDGNARDDPVVLKRAYRRALLSSHPDRASLVDKSAGPATPSVDHVRAAFLLLSSRSSPSVKKDDDDDDGVVERRKKRANEVVDLDDFVYCEGRREYTLACRCGHGFCVRETDLAEGDDLVACDGCSLLVQVLFEEVPPEEEEDEADHDDQTTATRKGPTEERKT